MVTIPNAEVSGAVKETVNSGFPVVGINSGAMFGKDAGTTDFVAPDDVKGGKLAGETLLSLARGRGENENATINALYIDGDSGNQASVDRLTGLRQAIGEDVESLSVDEADPSAMEATISDKLSGCPYDAILLSDPHPLPAVIAAYEKHGCTIEKNSLGTFETSEQVYDAIGNDQLDFTIDNQQYLQGALGTILTAVVVTTGKSLAPSGIDINGAYLAGPKLVTKFDLPTDTVKVCEAEAFPVCSDNVKSSRCACTDRIKVKIGGVTHGVVTDRFWDPIYAATEQAALDMNVELLNERFDAGDDQGSDVLHTRMANRIEYLCTREDVDGLFVSIPNDTVLPAIQKCLDLDIPVMSINAGGDKSQEIGLKHHIGQVDYNAGKGAGEYMIKSGMKKGVCANHAKGVQAVEDRCSGFAFALAEANIPYLGQVYVPDDNNDIYTEKVENLVDEEGDWSGIGHLANGKEQHIPSMTLKQRHKEVLIGGIDLSAELFDAIDAGNALFGVGQEPYLQGYMPVVLLTYAATTGQHVTNHVIESGPVLIENSPSEDQQVCAEIVFEACKLEDVASAESSSQAESFNKTGLIVGICILAVGLLLISGFFMYRINALNKHIVRLEAQGYSVEKVSMSQRMLSLVKPVDQVIPLDDTYCEDAKPGQEHALSHGDKKEGADNA
ncbi:hypothetical protein ACHAWF_009777 [Thalassiosira exigua]